jgi:RNA polymerase sigma factor (TIGR02999 family)
LYLSRDYHYAEPRFHVLGWFTNQFTGIRFPRNELHLARGRTSYYAAFASSIRHWVVSDVTQILHRLQQGDARAPGELLPLVYEELRKLAAARMAHEWADQTLQPTALVHEAWLRLTNGAQPSFDGRGHFFAAAAEAMRRVLVENARRKGRLKRGGEWKRVGLENLDVAVTTDDDTLLAVHEALEKLAAIDSIGAKLIELRFFAGMSNVDAAKALGLAERTAKRTWAYARAWLHEELTRPS